MELGLFVSLVSSAGVPNTGLANKMVGPSTETGHRSLQQCFNDDDQQDDCGQEEQKVFTAKRYCNYWLNVNCSLTIFGSSGCGVNSRSGPSHANDALGCQCFAGPSRSCLELVGRLSIINGLCSLHPRQLSRFPREPHWHASWLDVARALEA